MQLTDQEERRCRKAVAVGASATRVGSTLLEDIGPAIGAGSSAAANLDGESK
jgi:hypothetical protein